MNIPEILTGVVKPVTDLVDNLHTSEKEKAEIKRSIFEMKNNLMSQLVKSKGEIIKAEAESEHFLTSTWRPITALVFVVIIANNYIIAPYMEVFMGTKIILKIPPQMWDLLKIMIGGYVVGRSAEKGVRVWKK
ncbi:MAG: holin family protein [Halanaerobiales bacterium]|nr:holin family protein [Halanaerobiales bacterium]